MHRNYIRRDFLGQIHPSQSWRRFTWMENYDILNFWFPMRKNLNSTIGWLWKFHNNLTFTESTRLKGLWVKLCLNCLSLRQHQTLILTERFKAVSRLLLNVGTFNKCSLMFKRVLVLLSLFVPWITYPTLDAFRITFPARKWVWLLLWMSKSLGYLSVRQSIGSPSRRSIGSPSRRSVGSPIWSVPLVSATHRLANPSGHRVAIQSGVPLLGTKLRPLTCHRRRIGHW